MNIVDTAIKRGVKGCNTNPHHNVLYQAWKNMRQRCMNPRRADWPRYGGRGISVCERWSVFGNFLSDMQEGCGPGKQLDRIDNNGNYGPDNCRWATRKEQCNNTRNNKPVTFNGETRNLLEWVKITGIARNTLSHRLLSGWPVDIALTTPARKSARRVA